MNYGAELRLLCETFKKCRISAVVVNADDSIDHLVDESFRLLFGSNKNILLENFFNKLQQNVIYRLSSSMGFCYIFMLLPDTIKDTVLAIGPYLSVLPDKSRALEVGERYNITPKRQKLFENYYMSIPYLSADSHLFVLLYAFAERIWSSTFSVIEVDENFLFNNETLTPKIEKESEDMLLKMKLMEERYAVENEMIRAVSLGQMHKNTAILSSLATMPFEKRLDDPLRNLKNYGIIMNTLLRKAAERSGVHPIYLDEISSDFARRIEGVPSVVLARELMTNMYSSYCRLVQKHITENYSPPVQKALLMIDSELSSDISLRTLAAAQSISPSYLSDIFKKETGKTVTEYINTKRMRLAAHLLETTALQIQTVALHCGILDVQYFSKLFKKHFGMTPKAYRQEKKK